MVTKTLRTVICFLSMVTTINAMDFNLKILEQPCMAPAFLLHNTSSVVGSALLRSASYIPLIAGLYKSVYLNVKEYPRATCFAACAAALYFYNLHKKSSDEAFCKSCSSTSQDLEKFFDPESIFKNNGTFAHTPTVNVCLTVTKAPAFFPYFVSSWVYNTGFFTNLFKTSTVSYRCQWKQERNKTRGFKGLLDCSAAKEALNNGFIYSLTLFNNNNKNLDQLSFTTHDTGTLKQTYGSVNSKINRFGLSQNSYWLWVSLKKS